MVYPFFLLRTLTIRKASAATSEVAVAEAVSKAARAKAAKVTGASVVVARQRDNNKNVRICIFRFARSAIFLTCFSVQLVSQLVLKKKIYFFIISILFLDIYIDQHPWENINASLSSFSTSLSINTKQYDIRINNIIRKSIICLSFILFTTYNLFIYFYFRQHLSVVFMSFYILNNKNSK